MRIKEIEFKTLTDAKNYKRKFRKDYGYTPAIFRFPYEHRYVIVKPSGLKKIR